MVNKEKKTVKTDFEELKKVNFNIRDSKFENIQLIDEIHMILFIHQNIVKQ